MQPRASKTKPKKAPKDPVLFAKAVMENIIGEKWDRPAEKPLERVKNPHAVAMAALGAAKGGRARAESLTAKQRSKIAKKAAKARWGKVA
jgi:hypothetical protein